MVKAAKILVILGPTAVGKTDLGIKLAKKFNGELVACDSRQVYTGLDIGTAKYSPNNTFKKFKGRWLLNDVWIHGYDLVGPNKQFTAADYAKFFAKTVKKILEKGKLPILVGGTGFYLKAALEGFETLGIPPNKKLRKELENLTAGELFRKLLEVNPDKAKTLSPAEAANPQRLIRAIEVANFLKSHPHTVSMYPYMVEEKIDTLKIGLTAPRKILYEMIDKRVDKRIGMGLINEVSNLLRKGAAKKLKKFGLEYKYITEIVMDGLKKDEAISKLKFAIHDFARRQLTWFKKEKNIVWFDIIDKNYYSKVEKLVAKWYTH